jgi:hypothetical protein
MGESDFLMTPAQVAERLQVSVAWVRDHSTPTRQSPSFFSLGLSQDVEVCGEEVSAFCNSSPTGHTASHTPPTGDSPAA